MFKFFSLLFNRGVYMTISWEDFEKIELRIGTIVGAKDFLGARVPAYKLLIDLGKEIGIKKSSAQITTLYSKEELIGKQVICVTNFPPRQIANFLSEVLTTGFYTKGKSDVVLAVPDKKAENGLRLA
jgi:tRNA-binding protein